MKDIRIFVASSKELIAERNQLAFLVLSMEGEFAERGLRGYIKEPIDESDDESKIDWSGLGDAWMIEYQKLLKKHGLPIEDEGEK